MRSVRVSSSEWPGVTAAVAVTFRDRLFGIRSRRSPGALIIDSRLLHTLGLSGPLQMVALDDDRRVVDVKVVAPNRLVRFKGARWVLEIEEGVPPQMGAQLEFESA